MPKHRITSTAFHRAVVLTFPIVLVTFLFLGRIVEKALPVHEGERKPASLPTTFTEPFVSLAKNKSHLIHHRTSMTEVKPFNEWWFYSRSASLNQGVGLKLTQDAELFSEVFPGYPDEMRLNTALWKTYFTRPFQSYTAIPSLLGDQGFYVALSSTGCLDIFQQYGADVILFGNSETLAGIQPGLLQKGMGSGGRILTCGRTAQHANVISGTLEELGKLGALSPDQKIKHVVIGYSHAWGYADSRAWTSFLREQSEELRDYVVSTSWGFGRSGLFGMKGKDLFSPPRWAEVEPLNLERWQSTRKPVEAVRREASGQTQSPEIARGQIVPDLTIYSFQEADRGMLPEWESQLSHDYFIYDKAKEKPCAGSALAERQLHTMVQAALKVADEVDIVLLPVTEAHLRGLPGCMLERIHRQLAAVEGPRVRVKMGGREEYSITLEDYTYKRDFNGNTYFDPHHLSLSGSRKLSAGIGKWIAAQGGTDGLLKP